MRDGLRMLRAIVRMSNEEVWRYRLRQRHVADQLEAFGQEVDALDRRLCEVGRELRALRREISPS